MNKLTAIRIKYDDGTYSDEIPVSTLAEYILWDDSHNLVDILGNIDMSKGTVQAQLNDKIDNEALAQYLSDEISADVTNWLNTYVTPVGSAVIVDSGLTIEGAAADAKATGDALSELNERLGITENKIDDIVPGLTDTAKIALLNCFANVSWNNNGKVYYDALVAALYDSYPRISATYNPGVNVIYTDDTLNTLKQYITVKYYATSESEGVVIGSNSYTLSGTLAEGTNNITVTYDELTTTVIVSDVIDFYNIWEWDSRFTGAGKLTRTPVRAGEFTYEGVSRKGILYNTSLISGNNNRGFATLRGKAPMVTEDNVTLSNYYPIPIPATATKLIATITPNTQRLSPVLFQYDPTNQTPAPYSRIGSIAWYVGEQTVTFTASENLFLAFNCSIDAAFTRYTPETEPEMNVVFE